MEKKEALKKLRKIYPHAKVVAKNGMVTKDGKFLAWVKRGVVDTSLLPELRDNN